MFFSAKSKDGSLFSHMFPPFYFHAFKRMDKQTPMFHPRPYGLSHLRFWQSSAKFCLN
ncbi:hypothetical protein CL3_04660 [butyrate-producing bacterium SM4/1]|nr:hypothetical protein CL3_04660 [butyrate-producing bacterium SM4/1]